MSSTEQQERGITSPLDSLVALAKGMWVTLKHFVSRPDVTVEFPFEKRAPFPRVHGRHILNRYPNGMEKCIGCELCAGACPADAILVWGEENPPDAPVSPGERYGAVYQINMLRCIFCGLCVEACPTDAITMTTFFEFTGPSRSGLVYTKEELLELPPGPEREKFGYTGEPAMLPLSETEQPGVGHLGGFPDEPAEGGTDVPVVWLPEDMWRRPYEPEAYVSPAAMQTGPDREPGGPEAISPEPDPSASRLLDDTEHSEDAP